MSCRILEIARVAAVLVFAGCDREAGEARYRLWLDRMAQAESRPLEGRLLGSPYRTYRPMPRRIDSATGTAVLRGGPGEPRSWLTPFEREARALDRLFRGEIEAAQRDLESAAAESPGDGRLLNNLAALRLETSESMRPIAALRAFEAATAAFGLTGSEESAWNRARALSRVPLRYRAAERWREYFELDGDSPWAQEGRRSLASLAAARDSAAPPVGEDAGGARRRAERELADWGRLIEAGDEVGAEKALAQAEISAAETVAAGGDPLAAEAVATIRGAATDPRRRHQLAAGYSLLGRGGELLRAEYTGDAHEVFASAIAACKAARSSCELAARLAWCRSAPVPPWRELMALVDSKRGRGTLAEAGALRHLALLNGRELRIEAALKLYERAADVFATLNEWEEWAVMMAMMAELYGDSHRSEDAAVRLAQALGALPRMSDPLNRYSVLVPGAWALKPTLPFAALELRREAGALCAELPNRPLCVADSWLAVARFARKLPQTRPEEVAEVIAAAQAAAERAGASDPGPSDPGPSDKGALRTRAEAAALEALWLLDANNPEGDADRALERGREAAQEFTRQRLVPLLLNLYAEEARALDRAGREREADELLELALAHIRSAAEASERLGETEPIRLVFEQLIDRAVAAQDAERGLALAEELRDYELDGFSTAGAPLSLSVPVGTAALRYFVSGDRILVWLIVANRIDLIFLPATDLKELRRQLEALPSVEQEPLWREQSADLFGRLVAPVVRRMPAATHRVLVIPDAELAAVPFRALWDPARERYLEDLWLVDVAPRLSVLAAAPARQRPNRAAVMAVEHFADELGLAPLPAAQDEARAVAAVYGGAVDCGRDWASLVACMPGSEVVHLATHAQAGARAWLAFADETVGFDQLQREMPPLSGVRLVFLSACRSSDSARRGFGGLAQPFLAKGAESVIGSLWELEDTAALSRFMSAFHQAYRTSGDAAQALRDARRAERETPLRPNQWGAFIVTTTRWAGGS